LLLRNTYVLKSSPFPLIPTTDLFSCTENFGF
jgi:hypothetical protein